MVSRALIDDFLAQRTLALAGVSRSGKGFGNAVRRELGARGYTLKLIHPEADSIGGQPCVHALREVAPEVGGVVLVTPPAETLKLLREAQEAGIRRVWIQEGAESDAAIAFCGEHGLAAVHHECILMFIERAAWPHRLHRAIRGAFGHLPT